MDSAVRLKTGNHKLYSMLYEVTIDGKNYKLELNRAEGQWSCRLDGRDLPVDGILIRPDVLSLRIGNLAYEIKSERVGSDLNLWVGSTRFTVDVRDPRSLRGRTRTGDAHGPKKITASMPGKVVRLLVHEGDDVEPGDGIAVVEAMKMQNDIKSPRKGVVQKMFVTEGAAVNAGDVLAIIE
jgi:biotin carboxyl carrier protein